MASSYVPYKKEANEEEVLQAAEAAVHSREAAAAKAEQERREAQLKRKAAIRAKGLPSLPDAKKGAVSASESGDSTPLSPDDPLYDATRTEAAMAQMEAEEAAAADAAAKAAAAAAAEQAEHEVAAAYKRRVEQVLTEFWTSHDFDDAMASLRALEPPSRRPEIAKRILLLALDRSDTDKELASRLLSALYGNVLTMMHIADGFLRLFDLGLELETDTPGAVGILARFLARAVVDEVLPPSFLMDEAVQERGGPVVAEARALLSAPHAATRLEHVWGAAAAAGVAELKEQVRLMCLELFGTGSVEELERCVRDLEAPRFHHEVVKRLVVMSLERGEAERDLVARALARLGPEGVGLVSEMEAERGLRRVVSQLPDLSLDTPAAPSLVEALVTKLRAVGVVGAKTDLAARSSAAGEAQQQDDDGDADAAAEASSSSSSSSSSSA